MRSGTGTDSVVILGAHGKLGRILARYARGGGLGWTTQGRCAPADIIWSGDTASPDVFVRGATLINMIGATTGGTAQFSKINVEFVKHLLLRAAEAGVAHVILASSAAVYGNGGERPRREDDAPAPITAYGHSKTAMEDIARSLIADRSFRRSGLRITVLRIANVAGADAFLAAAEDRSAHRSPLSLHRFANGSAATRSYIGPRDLFETVKTLIDTDRPLRRFNIAHPQPVTLDALAQAYKTQLLPDLTWTDTRAPATIPATVTLSTHKVSQYYPYAHHAGPALELARQVAQYRTL